jgi:hypothetical protein
MQKHKFPASKRTPPPDVVRRSNAVPPPPIAYGTASTPSAPPIEATPPDPEFLIIGLFALRLTERLIESLENYPGRDADMAWIANFLAPYSSEYALAKISGPRKEDYLSTYQDIVSRMKKQPRYPMRFMQMNPDRSIQQRMARSEAAREDLRDMTDRTLVASAHERLALT